MTRVQVVRLTVGRRLLSGAVSAEGGRFMRIHIFRCRNTMAMANLVKFRLELVPVVGLAAMAFPGGSASLLMLDLENLIEIGPNSLSPSGHGMVDYAVGALGPRPRTGGMDLDSYSAADEENAKAVRHVMSGIPAVGHGGVPRGAIRAEAGAGAGSDARRARVISS